MWSLVSSGRPDPRLLVGNETRGWKPNDMQNHDAVGSCPNPARRLHSAAISACFTNTRISLILLGLLGLSANSSRHFDRVPLTCGSCRVKLHAPAGQFSLSGCNFFFFISHTTQKPDMYKIAFSVFLANL